MNFGSKENPIDMGKLMEVFDVSVNRAVWFTAIALNRTSDPLTREDLILRDSIISFQIPTTTNLKEVKYNFQQWILLNGLREIFQGLERVLDIGHEWLLILDLHKEIIDRKTFQKNRNSFVRFGLIKKLESISAFFESDIDIEKIKSISQARNCITHRGSMIGDPDVDSDKKFVLKWSSCKRAYVRLENGTEFELDSESQIELDSESQITETSELIVNIIDKEKIYNVGDRLEVAPTDLCDMILSIKREGLGIISSINNIFKNEL